MFMSILQWASTYLLIYLVAMFPFTSHTNFKGTFKMSQQRHKNVNQACFHLLIWSKSNVISSDVDITPSCQKQEVDVANLHGPHIWKNMESFQECVFSCSVTLNSVGAVTLSGDVEKEMQFELLYQQKQLLRQNLSCKSFNLLFSAPTLTW